MAALKFLKLGLLQASLAAAASVSRQIQLGSDEYFLPPTAAWSFDSWSAGSVKGDEEFAPLTVVNLDGPASTKTVVSILDKYNATDDVWTPHFADVLYIQSSSNSNSKDQGSDWTKGLSPDFNVSSVLFSGTNSSNITAAPGPYLVHLYTGNVYQAYKLYVDTNQAFLQSSYQDPHGTHHPVRAATHSAGGLTIAVPSRLYFTPTKGKPLAGLRIAVKDLYDLKGMKTSFGNRDVFEISEAKAETAVSVQKLIDAGAVIVGKNKLSEFAFAGPFVTEHIDYLLPFNPRGDGYNSPGDSSGGSAASVASYLWLDASMGSDTGGSIRGPATNNGIHGNRPTQDAVNLTGAGVLSTAMDTAGMFARDPVAWSKVNKALYAGTIKEYHKYPKVILLDSSYESILSASEEYPDLVAAAQDFVETLANLTSANVTEFSIDDAWDETSPSAFEGAPIAGIVNAIYGNLTTYEQWNEFGRDFVQKYMEFHNGDFPHMSPGTREGWLNANETITEDIHKQDLEYKKLVSKWVGEEFLASDDNTCSDAVYLYFNAPGVSFQYKPDVRQSSNPYIQALQLQISMQQDQILELNATINCNTTLGSDRTCQNALQDLSGSSSGSSAGSVSAGRLASVAGLPDYAITLGSFDLGQQTFSNSTLKTQSLPLGVDIVAAKGCDFMILNLAEELHRKGAIRVVETGALA